MQTFLPRVLIIDDCCDERLYLLTPKLDLKDRIIVNIAPKWETVRELIPSIQSYDAIVANALKLHPGPSTLDLIAEIKTSGYRKPIIAVGRESGSLCWVDEAKKQGATHSVPRRMDVPEFLVRYFELLSTR